MASDMAALDKTRRAWLATLAIAVAAVAASTVIRVAGQGLWWDEAVYLGLARALRAGHFTLETGVAVESCRPPVLPCLLFLFGGNPSAARVLTGLITVAALAVVAQARGDSPAHGHRHVALLFALCMPGLVFYGSKVLAESTCVLLLAVAFLCLRKAETRGHWLWSGTCGLLLGMAFMTKYIAVLATGCFALALLFDVLVRRKGVLALVAMLAGFAVAVLPIVPLGLRYYGTWLGAVAENQRRHFAAYLSHPPWALWKLGLSLNVLVPFMVIGLAAIIARRRSARPSEVSLALIVPSSLVFCAVTPSEGTRFLVSFAWAYVILATMGFFALFDRLGRGGRFLLPGLATLAALGVAAASYASSRDANVGESLIAAADHVKRNTAPNDQVLSVSMPFVYYSAERRPRFVGKEEAVSGFMRERGIEYALLSRFEGDNPPFLGTFFDRHPEAFEKVRVFPERGHPEAAVVYLLRLAAAPTAPQ